jgi:putative membrane protein
MSRQKIHLVLLLIFLAVLIWSAIHPHDYFTWMLEVTPAVLGVILCLITYKRFELSMLLYVLILIHAIILMVGGKYTYAEVPLFNWLQAKLGTARNSYDGVGHFAQGFIPAILAREILIRTSPIKSGKWLFFLSICVPLAFSAFYEFIEWWVALGTGEAADAFLGAQGDPWDTQKDMCLCLIGSILSLVLLSAAHDRSLAKLQSRPSM